MVLVLAATLASIEMVSELLALHPLDTNLPYSNTLLDFQFISDLKLIVKFVRSIFLCMFLLVSVLFGMGCKHLQDSFDLKN